MILCKYLIQILGETRACQLIISLHFTVNIIANFMGYIFWTLPNGENVASHFFDAHFSNFGQKAGVMMVVTDGGGYDNDRGMMVVVVMIK